MTTAGLPRCHLSLRCRAGHPVSFFLYSWCIPRRAAIPCAPLGRVSASPARCHALQGPRPGPGPHDARDWCERQVSNACEMRSRGCGPGRTRLSPRQTSRPPPLRPVASPGGSNSRPGQAMRDGASRQNGLPRKLYRPLTLLPHSAHATFRAGLRRHASQPCFNLPTDQPAYIAAAGVSARQRCPTCAPCRAAQRSSRPTPRPSPGATPSRWVRRDC